MSTVKSDNYEGTLPANPLVFRTASTERMRIDGSGLISISNAIKFSGITSTNSKTLDAYEEGIYTINNSDFKGGSIAGSYTLTSDSKIHWTRVGRHVFLQGKVGVSSIVSSGSGNLRIENITWNGAPGKTSNIYGAWGRAGYYSGLLSSAPFNGTSSIGVNIAGMAAGIPKSYLEFQYATAIGGAFTTTLSISAVTSSFAMNFYVFYSMRDA